MRERVLFVVALVAFVAIVPVVYYILFEHGLSVYTPRRSLPRAPVGMSVKIVEEQPLLPVALSLTELEGKVEILREGGSWKPAEEGTVLGDKDRIRTDPSSRAVLSMPGFFLVELDVASEFEVKSLAEDVSRFLLEQGMISAEVVDNPNRQFEVSAASSVARTQGADFKMSLDQQRMVTLGTRKGSVEVEAGGKVIQVQEGYLTRIAKGKTPQDPIRIPSGLFLKVRWPKKRELSSRHLAVSGRTAPGARVRVDGVTVLVDSRGRFRNVVVLNEGVNQVKVEAYDVGGNLANQSSPSMHVDTRPDAFQIRTSPEMWKKRENMRKERNFR